MSCQDEAVKSLNKIRPTRESQSGQTTLEADAWELAIEESKKQNHGSWKDLFGRTYINRTIVSGDPLSHHPQVTTEPNSNHPSTDCHCDVLLPANYRPAVCEQLRPIIL